MHLLVPREYAQILVKQLRSCYKVLKYTCHPCENIVWLDVDYDMSYTNMYHPIDNLKYLRIPFRGYFDRNEDFDGCQFVCVNGDFELVYSVQANDNDDWIVAMPVPGGVISEEEINKVKRYFSLSAKFDKEYEKDFDEVEFTMSIK